MEKLIFLLNKNLSCAHHCYLKMLIFLFLERCVHHFRHIVRHYFASPHSASSSSIGSMYSKQLVSREELKIQSKENLRRINSVINEDTLFIYHFTLGVRVGEICRLEWKHINFEEMTVEIKQQLVQYRR